MVFAHGEKRRDCFLVGYVIIQNGPTELASSAIIWTIYQTKKIINVYLNVGLSATLMKELKEL